MHYHATAQFLKASIPEVVHSYRTALLAVRSPLATRKDAWPKCREQAQTILEDCVTALSGSQPPEAAEARRYSQLVGADRASQGIAMAESIRAVEILWSAMQPAVRKAVQCEPAARQPSAQLLISTAFRSSAGNRLYAGAIGYGEAVNRGAGGTADEAAEAGAPGAVPAQAAAYAELSQREREVLDGVARALTNGQIARELGIQTATVKRHLNNVYGKLQAQSRIDAVNKAFGLVHGRSGPEEDQGAEPPAR
ncbi:response regulator transcription factor [Streptacidiphilus sp. N1-12]|uniref:Response regulator transcription factor n=2 Tax=Streptacidiphilus alkalitolerans TaxID=3342712 RepID=A0ABV6WDV5_9ACTN